MLTLDYVKKMITSLKKEDDEFTFGDVYNWYEKHSDDFIHLKFPINENHTVFDKILHNNIWETVIRAIRLYTEDLVDTDFDRILVEIKRFEDLSKIDVLERDYTDEEKSLILITVFDKYKTSDLTENEIILFKKIALEFAEKELREGLLAVGYGSYGGDGIFECDYHLSEKCMLKLFDTVDKIPEKGFYANTLGYIYYYGRTNGGLPDYEKSLKYFSFGANCGVYESIYKLSDMYLNGYGGIKSISCGKNLLINIYGDLYNLFLEGKFDCEFADVALRLGKIAMNETCDGFPTYAAALSYFMEAEYGLSKRKKFGDENVKKRLDKAISEVKEKMNFELFDEIEIHSLDYILWKNSGRNMVATVSKISNKKYNLNVKINKDKSNNKNKLFACYYDIGICGLFDEINVPISTYGDIKEIVFEFDDVSYKDLVLNGETVYTFPHNSTFLVKPDIVK